MNDKMIGERLRELRLNHGYTTVQVAKYLGMDQLNYSKIEHGKRRLSKLSQLEKLCDLYDCTQDYILLRSDDYVQQEWKGVDTKIDLNAIAQVNIIKRYLKTLRDIEKRMEGKA